MPIQRQHYRGFYWGIVAALTSAMMAILIKMMADIPATTLVFFRFCIGLPFLLPFVYHKKVCLTWEKVPKNLVRSLGGIAAMYCYFYAVAHLPLVNAVTLSNTQPLFMPLIVLIWLKQIVSPLRWVAIAIGFIGVIILLRPTQAILFESASLIGLATGLFSAISMMGVRQLSKTESTETILCYYFLIATILTVFPMIWTWKPIADSITWLYLIALGLISTFFQYAITRAYTHAPATKMSTLNYFAVIFSGWAGWWFFGEVPNLWAAVGVLLIIVSALLVLLDPTLPKKIGSSQ